MVNNEIINTIANTNKEFVYNVVVGRPTSKEDVKNLILDLLRNCTGEEIVYVMGKLNEDY